ncbi:MAG TPA: hypothetical protein VIN35_06475 [Hydrogenophaga sp.]
MSARHPPLPATPSAKTGWRWPVISWLALPLLAGALWAWPSTGQAEANLGGAAGKASASLNFRIVIPPVLQVLENSHPQQIQTNDDGSATTAEQKLVVVSNMKHGFCIALRHPGASNKTHWQLQQSPTSATGSGAVLSPSSDGYRLCTARAGRFTLVLRHQFAGASQAPLAWPVQAEFLTL